MIIDDIATTHRKISIPKRRCEISLKSIARYEIRYVNFSSFIWKCHVIFSPSIKITQRLISVTCTNAIKDTFEEVSPKAALSLANTFMPQSKRRANCLHFAEWRDFFFLCRWSSYSCASSRTHSVEDSNYALSISLCCFIHSIIFFIFRQSWKKIHRRNDKK